jgi:hypothetical protein
VVIFAIVLLLEPKDEPADVEPTLELRKVPTQADVTEIALSLPGVSKDPDYFSFAVEVKGKRKGIAWIWRERVDPKQARVPNPQVIAIRVADEIEKATLLGADPEKFFTEPHYNGYAAVLVRLNKVTKTELRRLLTEAHRCQAPPATEPARKKTAPKRARKKSAPRGKR